MNSTEKLNEHLLVYIKYNPEKYPNINIINESFPGKVEELIYGLTDVMKKEIPKLNKFIIENLDSNFDVDEGYKNSVNILITHLSKIENDLTPFVKILLEIGE